MDHIASVRGPFPLRPASGRWRVASIVLPLGAIALLVVVLVANLEKPHVALEVPIALATAILLFAFVFARVLLQFRRSQHESARMLETKEDDLRQMADNIQETFWTIDAESKRVLGVNRAFEAITGRPRQSLIEDPLSYREIIHPDDRPRVFEKLEKATRNGELDERFRIVRADGAIRWLWVRAAPVRDTGGKISRLVGTALDITSQKKAEVEVERNLALARSAWAEADALRKATLGLTQDLRMNHVLDTLLQSLTELISCECARVLLLDGDSRLLVARERLLHPVARDSTRDSTNAPPVFEANHFPFFHRIVSEQQSVLVGDTQKDSQWQAFSGHQVAGHHLAGQHLAGKDQDKARSWLGIPLIASRQTLGVLSLGHSEASAFTEEHLRLGNSLAIPAAAAIQNARLYERAALYGSELGKRVDALDAAGRALRIAEEDRQLSEARFDKVFSASPLPFSITTAAEGRFLEVNPAFELRYGYSRAELIGRTLDELRIWENAADLHWFLTQLERGIPIRNAVTRLRSKSGESKPTTYSADWMDFHGHACMFLIFEDMVSQDVLSQNKVSQDIISQKNVS